MKDNSLEKQKQQVDPRFTTLQKLFRPPETNLSGGAYVASYSIHNVPSEVAFESFHKGQTCKVTLKGGSGESMWIEITGLPRGIHFALAIKFNADGSSSEARYLVDGSLVHWPTPEEEKPNTDALINLLLESQKFSPKRSGQTNKIGGGYFQAEYWLQLDYSTMQTSKNEEPVDEVSDGVRMNINGIIPNEVRDELNYAGSFRIYHAVNGEPLVAVCMRKAAWKADNELKAFTRETFPDLLRQSGYFRKMYKQGLLDELERDGFTEGVEKFNLQGSDYREAALDLVNKTTSQPLDKIRALAAKGILDPASRSKIVDDLEDKIVKGNQDIGEWSAAKSTQALFGGNTLRRVIFERGKSLARGNDNRFVAIVTSWAMLAAAANTAEEKQEAYDIIMKDPGNNTYIPMSGNSIMAGALLVSNDAQLKEVLDLASKKITEPYWEIQGGALVATAICSSEVKEKSTVFQLAKTKLKSSINHIALKYCLVAMAITAQNQEEKTEALNIIEIYTHKEYNGSITGWANIALGILGASESDRSLAIKSIAAAIESSR